MMSALKRRCVVVAILCMSSLAVAETAKAEPHKAKPAPGAYISKYYIADAAPGSTYETGPLHIVYSDGTDIVQELPPKEKSTEDNIVFNQEGFSDVQLAADRQTIGWTETYDNGGTSYSIPMVVVVFRSGKTLQSLDPGQMVWSWMFFEQGKRVAIVSGPTHGPEVGDFKLYDVQTGKVLSEVFGDEETQALKPDAPTWAKQLEVRLNGDTQNK